jgi:hypothetical protein
MAQRGDFDSERMKGLQNGLAFLKITSRAIDRHSNHGSNSFA